MKQLKEQLNKYLKGETDIDALNQYFVDEVPFSPDSGIEDLRLYADLTIEGELTEQDRKDQLISEKELKQKIKEYLKNL